MSDQIRDRLRQELEASAEPPMAGIVTAAVQAGRARRRARRLAGAGSGAVAVVAAIAIVAATQATVDHPSASLDHAAADVGKPTATTSADAQRSRQQQPPRPATAAHPAGVPATPQSILELLEQQLPAGTATSHYGGGPVLDTTGGVSTSEGVTAEEWIATPHGQALLRVSVGDTWNGCTSTTTYSSDGFTARCTLEPDGTLVVRSESSTNCIQNAVVEVVKPDGSVIDFELASCLDWDGSTNPASPSALTEDQAVALASDPRWDSSTDPALTAQGAKDFPVLQPFS